jgi:deoxyribonuclease-4
MNVGISLNNDYFNSLSNALTIARRLKTSVLQIYAGDKRLTTLRKKIKLTNLERKNIKMYIKNNNIKLFIHSILSLNLCNDVTYKRFTWIIENIMYDMNLCKDIGGIGVVIHTGTYKTEKLNISEVECIQNFIKTISIILDQIKDVYIILETPVQKPYKIGSANLEDFANLYMTIPYKYRVRVKCCIDTQHIFASGYNIRNIDVMKRYLNNFDKLIGINNLALIHLIFAHLHLT